MFYYLSISSSEAEKSFDRGMILQYGEVVPSTEFIFVLYGLCAVYVCVQRERERERDPFVPGFWRRGFVG